MKRKLLKKFLLAVGLLVGGSACATVYSTTYNFNSWVTTNTNSNGEQTTLTLTGENIATADAANSFPTPKRGEGAYI